MSLRTKATECLIYKLLLLSFIEKQVISDEILLY